MRFLGTLIFLMSATISSAQVRLSGKVTDSQTSEPLIGVHIYALNNWRIGTTTNVNGDFSLMLDSAVDSLVFTFIGYSELMLAVNQAHGNIQLDPTSQSFEEVVVTSSPLIAEEFKFVQMKKLDIYTNPTAKADPILAVNSLPSATTTDESANISFRGSSPMETGTFLNNVPIYDAVRYSQLNGIGTFSMFNTSIIKQVTVFPGNPPLEFGNTTSGLISLETDDQVLRGTSQSVILSLANLGYSRDQKINSTQSLKLFSNWQPSGAIKALNQESLEEIKQFQSGDVGAYWYGQVSDWSWKFFNYSLREAYTFDYRHPSFQGDFDQEKFRNFTVTSLDKTLNSGNLQINSGMSFSRSNFTYSSAEFEVDKKDYFLGFNYLLNREKFQLKSGFSLDHRFSAVDGRYHSIYYAQGVDHPTESFEGAQNSTSAESFTYFKYYLSDNLALGSGIRSNIPHGQQKFHLGRQINLSYTNGNWSLILGAGKYFKNGLSENSDQKLSISSEQVSMDLKLDKTNFTGRLTLFHKTSQINEVDQNTHGSELFLSYRLSEKINTTGSITLLNATSNNAPHPYDISHFIRHNFSYSPGKLWTIETTLLTRQGTNFTRVISADFDDELSVYEPTSFTSRRFDNYFNLSTSISKVYTIGDSTSLVAFFSIANITDHRNVREHIYSFDYSRSTPSFFSRRTAYFGVMVSF